MPALREVQAAFRRALIEEDEEAILALIDADGIGASERVAIYRNNVACALSDVLRGTFPAVCRLVDERFFVYAAHVFVQRHPPERACLAEYGARFPDFLAAFPPCRELVYLPDVARLEWLMNVAAHAADADALAASALAGISADEALRLVFRLAPALGLIASPWPIDRIWRANRRDSELDEMIDLASGGVHLEVGRQGGEVVLRHLDAASFAFREAIARGATLGTATIAALSADRSFDLEAALAALFAESAIVASDIAPGSDRVPL
jgi:Putative DNA-binding domain